ncbi:DUF3486 family protein [Vibrio quintilis]|uniref:DUF3486 family protein n=1 Tax=Vibrio quintilis TaxID=1117707 RepID=A0A1M7Z1U0_9VIBR|nr:DUF3486 family protein [Vibrio quintilis]SHO58782.1 hypothetical protein VQ7734_04554 [Vibrio quintilis]
MNQPHTKNRKSKIDKLPDEIKSALNLLLREGQMSQQEIRDEINQLITDAGITDDDEYIKRNAMSRYAMAFEKGMENYRQTQQLTQKWVQQFGEKPQTDIARALIEIGKSQVFDFQMSALEAGETIDPKTMGQLALAIKRLQEAQTGSVKLEKEIRRQFAEEAADAISQELNGEDGMSEQFEARIRGILLGKA